MAQNNDDFTDEFAVEDAPVADRNAASLERETDEHRLGQRQKQIDFGKNTLGYQRYINEVPRDERKKEHPRTPDVHQKCSKRAFDGQVRKWRRMLHAWDDSEEAAADIDTVAQPKNGAIQRQVGGLPLKIPSAMRPTAKRQHSFLSALLSPTMAPPESKQAKTGAGVAIAMETEAAHPSEAVMASWRGEKEAGRSGKDEATASEQRAELVAMKA